MDDLFGPTTLGPMLLRNRFIKAATNEGLAQGCLPTAQLADFHQQIAAGGAGLTTVAYCAITADGRTFPDQVVLRPESLAGLRALSDAVHAAGGKACAQITHGGAFCFLPQLSTRWPQSASGGINMAGIGVHRWFKSAMREADLDRCVQDFVRAAEWAREAGFDAVEIHMGHGYLLSQFLSPTWNRRRDGWGGDAVRRARFPTRVLEAVRAAVGDELAVICKLSMRGGHRGGITLRDTQVTARALEQAGAHLLVLSDGMNVEAPWRIFGSRLPAAAFASAPQRLMRVLGRLFWLSQPRLAFEPLYLRQPARVIRDTVTMPLAYLGGLQTLEQARALRADGFEFLAMGRALVHQPDLINAFAAGRQSRSACTACNLCVPSMYTARGTHCVLTGAPHHG